VINQEPTGTTVQLPSDKVGSGLEAAGLEKSQPWPMRNGQQKRWCACRLSHVQKAFSCGNASFNAEEIPSHRHWGFQSPVKTIRKRNDFVRGPEGIFWQYIHRSCLGFSCLVPDYLEKVVRGSPGEVIFLCHRQEETMKPSGCRPFRNFAKSGSEVLRPGK
jgi:hypothetical protein